MKFLLTLVFLGSLNFGQSWNLPQAFRNGTFPTNESTYQINPRDEMRPKFKQIFDQNEIRSARANNKNYLQRFLSNDYSYIYVLGDTYIQLSSTDTNTNIEYIVESSDPMEFTIACQVSRSRRFRSKTCYKKFNNFKLNEQNVFTSRFQMQSFEETLETSLIYFQFNLNKRCFTDILCEILAEGTPNPDVTTPEVTTPEVTTPEVTTTTTSNSVVPRNCGQVNRATRIVGGVETEVNEYPWQTFVHTNGGLCGGSIITTKHILTAAHCTYQVNAALIDVYVGGHTLFSGQKIGVSQVHNHPSYNPSSLYNDISILVLDTALTYSQTVNKVCLPVSNYDPPVGSLVTVSGWGTTSYEGSTSNVLREVEVPTVSTATCQGSYGGSVNANMHICAGLAAGGKDSCQGDSGGPLIYETETNTYTQVGVVSWGNECALAGYYGVYARVSNYISWIETYTNGFD